VRTIVYIDGFNFYYSIRFTPYRWTDPLALSRVMFPTFDIRKVKYFTAKVKPHPDDPDARTRQSVYFRALETLSPTVELFEGRFIRKRTPMALDWPNDGRLRRALLALALGERRVLDHGNPKVRVIKTEEKGSDVNLATHLVSDAYEDRFDAAAVLSNDGDLVYPLSFVREKLGKQVILFNAAGYRHPRLAPVGTPGSSYKRIRHGALSASQFPAQLTDAKGAFHRPDGWDQPKKR